MTLESIASNGQTPEDRGYVPYMSGELGLLRVSVVAPRLVLGDPLSNARELRSVLEREREHQSDLVVFPELSLTGYTCQDLFYDRRLYELVIVAIGEIARASMDLEMPCVVGAPMEVNSRLYNCAVVFSGRSPDPIAFVPKTFLPNSAEYYERRWFTPAPTCAPELTRCGPWWAIFGQGTIFEIDGREGARVGVELCEDLWAVKPPSLDLALRGATIIVNLSASSEVLGKTEYRRSLVVGQSGRCAAAYCYAGAGPGESSTDLVFGGHLMIAENGTMLREDRSFSFATTSIRADIDIERCLAERKRSSSFQSQAATLDSYLEVLYPRQCERTSIERFIDPHPFVPSRQDERSVRCQEVFTMQATALARRLQSIGASTCVIGVSGGLDSTLALLACIHAFGLCNLSLSGIHAVSMPGLGTSQRTRTNARELSQVAGTSFREMSIREAVLEHFAMMDHDPGTHDIFYENAQARERTKILMNLTHKVGGIVIGTGDLSEIALGWSTYNADHMSMYNINGGVPKTLVRYVIDWFAGQPQGLSLRHVLEDILATPVSPELIPPDAGGSIAQRTEDIIGPYELHDFFLYHFVRFGSSPRKILAYAERAFATNYHRSEIIDWLRVFLRRFLTQQFKRSCMPDTVKIGTISLSPRGDWRMPSDIGSAPWISDLTIGDVISKGNPFPESHPRVDETSEGDEP